MSNSPKKSRLSIDNFWNVLTWIAMPLGVFVSAEYGSICGLIASFTLVPYILAKCNNIYFDPSAKEDTPLNAVLVFNKQGESLSMHLPFKFDMTKSWLVLIIIVMPFLIKIFHPDLLTGTIILFALLWLPMSYFIKNNIPISAFFNAKAWDYYEVVFVPNSKKTSNTSSSNSSRNSATTSSSLDNYYSPKKYYLSSNIYNRK
jgi:hypothetical protein